MKLTNSNRIRKKLAAEFVGTFVLVFAGRGAIIINDLSGGTITHVGVAITFGLVILTMIYTVGDVSGAHMNPADTFGFYQSLDLPDSPIHWCGARRPSLSWRAS